MEMNSARQLLRGIASSSRRKRLSIATSSKQQSAMGLSRHASRKEITIIAKNIKLPSSVQDGYYHIRAADLTEAIEIAKQTLEFQYAPTASTEVREVKTKETETGYIYPTQG